MLCTAREDTSRSRWVYKRKRDKEGLIVHQIDVETSYLYTELIKEIYMYSPVGMTVSSGKVLRLKKSLYGLKQSH